LGGKSVWEQVQPSWETDSCWRTQSRQSCQRSPFQTKTLRGQTLWVHPSLGTQICWQTGSLHCCQRSLLQMMPLWGKTLWVQPSWEPWIHWWTGQQHCRQGRPESCLQHQISHCQTQIKLLGSMKLTQESQSAATAQRLQGIRASIACSSHLAEQAHPALALLMLQVNPHRTLFPCIT